MLNPGDFFDPLSAWPTKLVDFLAPPADSLRRPRQVLSIPADGETPSGKPALLFLAGAFAGPWAWHQHFLPYFSERGHDCHAMEYRRFDRDGSPAGIVDYAHQALAARAAIEGPVVLVGHSLGALVAQWAAARAEATGLALLTPVPPAGLAMASLRLASGDFSLWRRLVEIALSPDTVSASFASEALFATPPLPSELGPLMDHFEPESPRAITEAQQLQPLSSAAWLGLPALVLSAEADRLLPSDAAYQTALFHGAEHRRLAGIGHALMLDKGWETAAEALGAWLDGLSD